MFTRHGADWILKREEAVDPMEIYLEMDRDRALVQAIARVKETGGILELHDVTGLPLDRLEFPRPTRRRALAMAA